MFKIYLPKSIKDPLEICAYAQMRKCSVNSQQYYSAKCIAYELGLKTNNEVTAIKNAMRRLVNSNALVGQEENGLFLVENSSFDLRGKKIAFANIYYEDIRKILACNFRYKLPLIKYYAVMSGTLGNADKVGSYGVNKLAEMCDTTPQTIYHYNSVLEELEIMFIVHSHANNGEPNAYGHHSNLKRIYASAKARSVCQGSKANWHRSVSARYNRYVATPEAERTFDAKLYEDVVAYNADMDELQLTQPGDDYAARKKDISVFIA